MDIKAGDIKTLREKTGAGMMDCKKALVEAKGDTAAAEKLLKEWGLAGVEKRSGRATNEGRVFVKESGNKVAMIEIACETDFVARNADFVKSGAAIAAVAYDKEYTSKNAELEAMVRDIASVIKENIALKRVACVKAAAGEVLHTYIHGEGSVGVVVKAKTDKSGDADVLAFIHDVALHIAAFRPMFLDRTKVSAAYLAEQQDIFQKQLEGDEKMKGKPAKVVEGILKGKVNKLMAEICLMDQGFVKDEKLSVSKVMADVAKKAGASLAIVDYSVFRVGED